MRPLNEVAVNTSSDSPGIFYKETDAERLLSKAFTYGGSCARVVKDPTGNDVQQREFGQFAARLKAKESLVSVQIHCSVVHHTHIARQLFTTINARSFVFCSSENKDICNRLGISPILVGLSDNVLIAEVKIKDHTIYLDVVFNGTGYSW